MVYVHPLAPIRSIMNPLVPKSRAPSAFVGMVHLLPLPGSPRSLTHDADWRKPVDVARVRAARAAIDAAIDAATA